MVNRPMVLKEMEDAFDVILMSPRTSIGLGKIVICGPAVLMEFRGMDLMAMDYANRVTAITLMD